MNRDDYYLTIAHSVALRSTCMRRHYGAVLVKDDRIIATGFNGAAKGEPHCNDTLMCTRWDKPHNTDYTSDCPAVHAEANAIISAGREAEGATLYLGGWDCFEGDYIIKPEPCIMCQRLIKNAGIKEVIS